MRYSHCCGVRVGKPFHTRSTGRLAHLRGQSTKAPTELPVLSLTPQAAPVGLMNRLLAPTAVNASSAKLARLNDTSLLQKSKVKLPEEVVGMVENDHVKAWANLRTGDAEIYQTLPTDKPIPALAASSLVVRSLEIFNSSEFIVPDDTKVIIGQAKVLQGGNFRS